MLGVVSVHKPIIKWLIACLFGPGRAWLQASGRGVSVQPRLPITLPSRPHIVPPMYIIGSISQVLSCWPWELYSPYLLFITVSKVPLVSCLFNSFSPSSPWSSFETRSCLKEGDGLLWESLCGEDGKAQEPCSPLQAVFWAGRVEGRQVRQAKNSGGLLPSPFWKSKLKPLGIYTAKSPG